MKIIIGDDTKIIDSVINGGVIIIGNNVVVNNSTIHSNYIGIQTICGSSDVSEFIENNYDKLCEDNLQTIFDKKDLDILSEFSSWSLSQPDIIERFLSYLISAVNNETMTRVME